MATYHASITDEQAALIRNAPLFFVASADPALSRGPHDVGPVNVSAKGGVPLHILGPNRLPISTTKVQAMRRRATALRAAPLR